MIETLHILEPSEEQRESVGENGYIAEMQDVFYSSEDLVVIVPFQETIGNMNTPLNLVHHGMKVLEDEEFGSSLDLMHTKDRNEVLQKLINRLEKLKDTDDQQ